MSSARLISVAALWLLAGAQHFWITPQLERLPADYAEETSMTVHSEVRETPTGAWTSSSLTARRVEQTFVYSSSHSIVQGDLHWTNDAGVVEYENTGMYGVDRYSRQNLPGYGDAIRSGAFLFPRHTERKSYQYWDPMYIGGRVATFERTDDIDGVPVYVFRFTATGLDETAGYSQLPDVPERYRAHTDGHGVMWIEPVSGTMVDYEDQGVSYFVEPLSGERVADFYKWRDRYTPQTKTIKLKEAAAARRRILALEIWTPAGLALAGLLLLVAGFKRAGAAPPSTADRKTPSGQPLAEQGLS